MVDVKGWDGSADLVITIISGSPRLGSESGRVAREVCGLVRELGGGGPVCEIDLSRNPIPSWSDRSIHSADVCGATWETTLRQLRNSDGFVLVVPEWGGMVPPSLKELFLLCEGDSALAHKPALIIAVSSGDGGAYPVAELRMSSYKNTRICYIPEQVIIRNVATRDGCGGGELGERLRWALAVLLRYAHALAWVRSECVERLGHYPFGM